MKTSIFDMNFVLPPLVEMTEVEKDMPAPVPTYWIGCILIARRTHENINI